MRRILRCCCALLVVCGLGAQASPVTVVITRHYTPEARASGRYQYVPFDVPAGATSIRIEQTYDKSSGRNAVDLGLFEPGPLDFGSRAMRGWSGGARMEILLGPGATSPGYRPGPLPTGRWHVVLGLYKVAPEGVAVTLRVTVGTEAAATRRWYSGDLHLHTVHSDGGSDPAQVLDMARAAGLDFVAITDHNNTTHALAVTPDPDRKPLHIVGEEITTPGGHANVWGLKPGDWLDFRMTPQDPRMHDIAAAAHARGALFSINHPTGDCDACDWKQPVPEHTDAMEVWNSALGPQPAAIAIWDELLRKGKRITGVASSDWHRAPGYIGAGSVRVLADALTEHAILQAVAGGAVVMMRDPASPPPVVTVSSGGRTAGVGQTLAAARGAELDVSLAIPSFTSPGLAACPATCTAEISWNGRPEKTIPGGDGKISFRRLAEAGYLRVAVRSGSTVVALTNPVFVTLK
ncbi:MAG TPA: CehA/McbA family metallohydrolase [Vicinamibacterales bacterium]|nr:CehA/McbA family metallohydrolase [Vicinamibacterales bacterium]